MLPLEHRELIESMLRINIIKNEIISDKEIRIEKYKEKLKSDLQNMRKMEKLFQISQTIRARLLQAAGYKFHNKRFQKTDFEKQDKSGIPPLHHAAKNKYLQIFLNMIQMECQYIKAYEGTTPSHLAFKTNSYQSFQSFINNGADKDAIGNKGITPLSFGKLGIKTT